MQYDYYKVYLGTDLDGYKGPYMADSLEKVEYILNNADMFDKYLVIGHNNALDMALDIIKEVNKVLYNDKPIKYLDKVFLDISYSSGKRCDDKMKNKYFEC